MIRDIKYLIPEQVPRPRYTIVLHFFSLFHSQLLVVQRDRYDFFSSVKDALVYGTVNDNPEWSVKLENLNI